MSVLSGPFNFSHDGRNVTAYKAGDVVEGAALEAAQKQGLLVVDKKKREPAKSKPLEKAAELSPRESADPELPLETK